MIFFIYGKNPGSYGGEEQKNKAFLEVLGEVKEAVIFQNNQSDLKVIRYISAIIFFILGRSARVGYFYPLTLSTKQKKNVLSAKIILVSLPQNISIRILKKAKAQNKIILVDFADLISETYHRRSQYSTFPMNVFWSIEARRFKKFEDGVSALTSKHYFASAVDCISPNSSHLPPPTNLLTSFRHNPISKKPSYFLFGGALAVFQNRLALSLLNSNAQLNSVSIKIYGSFDRSFEKKYPNLEFLGQVSNIQLLLADCSGFVSPVPVSGGIQNKVLEALAMGTPVYTDYSVLRRIGISDFYPALVTYHNGNCQIRFNEEIDALIKRKALEFVSKNYGTSAFKKIISSEIKKQLSISSTG